MAEIAGRWIQDKPFENMSTLLDSVGVTDPQMKGMIMSMKPEIILTPSGGGWKYQLVTPQGSRAVTFSSGEEIDYVSIVGRPVKSTMVIEGNKMTETNRDPADANEITTITREFQGDTMNVVLKVKDVEANGTYKRVG